ncbi:MAG: EamA family transporter [Lentisphaeria bacterium]
MPYLLVVSVIWAFSFGLIKTHLAGMPAATITVLRLLLALAVFLPFWRPGRLPARLAGALTLTGAVQYGLMYLCYLAAFARLSAHEVALFTIFTPLWVTFWERLGRGALPARFWLAALLAVAGAAVLLVGHGTGGPRPWTGFLLVQASNAAFAWGQTRYRALFPQLSALREEQLFAWLYLGGVLAALPVLLLAGGNGQVLVRLTLPQAAILAYLGVLASGVCFFWWNRGARLVNAGVLAAMNNLKIPLAVLVSLVVFGERADPVRLALSCALAVLAVLVARSENAGRDRRFLNCGAHSN